MNKEIAFEVNNRCFEANEKFEAEISGNTQENLALQNKFMQQYLRQAGL